MAETTRYLDAARASLALKIAGIIVSVTLAIGGLIWASNQTSRAVEANSDTLVEHETRISVNENELSNINRRLDELKVGQREILQELRKQP